MNKEELEEEHFKTLIGATDAEYNARYSDLTGYLWTDEDWNVGGHNLLSELKSNVGKWLILEVELYEKDDVIPDYANTQL
jgi:hypothetical protein